LSFLRCSPDTRECCIYASENDVTNEKIKALTTWYYRRTTPADVRASLQKLPKERAPRGSYKTHISISLGTADRAADLASGSEDLPEKDAQDRRQAMMTTLTLPTFDDEDDQFSSK
jgi:hypothetical protein